MKRDLGPIARPFHEVLCAVIVSVAMCLVADRSKGAR